MSRLWPNHSCRVWLKFRRVDLGRFGLCSCSAAAFRPTEAVQPEPDQRNLASMPRCLLEVMSLLCRRKFYLFLEGLFNLYCIQEIRKFRGERGATIATGWNETTGLTHLLTMLWSDQTLFLLSLLTDSLIALQSSFLIYNQAIQLDFVKVKQQRCVTAFVLF